MPVSAKSQMSVSVGSKVFRKVDFERMPLVQRANIRGRGGVARFVDYGDTWRRVDKELFMDCLEYIITQNRRPMDLSKLLRALVGRKIAFRSGLYQDLLRKILGGAKLQFIHFSGEGYWPVKVPYEARGHPGHSGGDSGRTHYVEIFGTHQPAERKKRGEPVPEMPPTPLKPLTPWLRIRGQVCSFEFALRALNVRLQQRTPKQVEIRLRGPEGIEVVEQWLLYPTGSLVSIISGILKQEGKPLGADALLERMMQSRMALQTFNQRIALTAALYRYRRCGELAFVRGQGYWLNDKVSTGLFSPDGEQKARRRERPQA